MGLMGRYIYITPYYTWTLPIYHSLIVWRFNDGSSSRSLIHQYLGLAPIIEILETPSYVISIRDREFHIITMIYVSYIIWQMKAYLISEL